MKILQLPAYCEPEKVASSSLSSALRKAYIDAGFNIEIYAPTPTRGISQEVREKYRHIRYEERFDGKLVIHRFPLFREGKNPVVRAIRYLIENIIHYCKGAKTSDVSVILASSTPPTQGVLCGMLKKKLNVPFVYNLQDIFPDSLIDTNLAKKGSLIWKIGRRIEDYTYRNADAIIVISEGFKKNIMSKGVPEDKIFVVCNWPDDSHIFPVNRDANILFDRYCIPREKFIICYSGSIQRTQNWELLIEVARELVQKDILFVIVGEGDAKKKMQADIIENNLQNVMLFPYMPKEELNYVFSIGDMGLIISKPNTGNSAVPSKTWNIMQAQRPILASFDLESDLCELIQNTKSGLVSDAGDKEGLLKNILYAYENQEQIREFGKNGQRYVESNLTSEICTGKYVDVLMKVIGEYGKK